MIPFPDLLLVVFYAALAALVVTAVALGLLHLLRARSVAVQLGVVAAATVLATVSGIMVISVLMLINDHDRSVVLTVVVSAGLVATVVSVLLGRRLVAANRVLVEAVRADRFRAPAAPLPAELAELSRELEETVDLSILDGDRARFVDQVVSPHRLRAISAVGESFPLHCCANGKALLATLSPAQQAQVLPSRLARLTEHTITTPAALRKELERIQLDGVAYDREEQTDGVCAVGAAVRVGEQMVAVSVPVLDTDIPAGSPVADQE